LAFLPLDPFAGKAQIENSYADTHSLSRHWNRGRRSGRRARSLREAAGLRDRLLGCPRRSRRRPTGFRTARRPLPRGLSARARARRRQSTAPPNRGAHPLGFPGGRAICGLLRRVALQRRRPRGGPIVASRAQGEEDAGRHSRLAGGRVRNVRWGALKKKVEPSADSSRSAGPFILDKVRRCKELSRTKD